MHDFENIDDFEGEELCPSVGMFVNLLMMDKPFGIVWSREHQINFLKKLGYKIIDMSVEDDTVLPIQVAVKPDSDVVPNSDDSNIDEVFIDEIQSILLDWLLKIREKH